MLTVRWFFLAQFSNFRSLSRRKFAHIFYTYTNFRRNKKKSGRVSIPKWLWCSGFFFLQSNVFQHNAMSIKENLKNDRKKNRRQPKKNYKKHFNSQTLAFIVDYLNSCNKHPFFIVVLSSLLLDKLETTERTNYKHHNIHSIRWWRWKSSKLFFLSSFSHLQWVDFFFFALAGLRFTD